jgi:hypothetical protein
MDTPEPFYHEFHSHQVIRGDKVLNLVVLATLEANVTSLNILA